jgi:hypothetical protein
MPLSSPRKRGEDDALAAQPIGQLEIIVDLAVVADDDIARGVTHRLTAAGRKIDDREAPMREADLAGGVEPQILVVRAAMRLQPGHPRQRRGADAPSGHDPGNSAHLRSLPNARHTRKAGAGCHFGKPASLRI